MGLYRDETGRVIEIDDRFAEARGYTPITALEENASYQAEGLEARGTERGVLGSVQATASGLASGMTLGGTDYLLGKTLPDAEREQLLAEIEAHPYLRTGGEIVGTIAAAALTGGGATPTGYLSRVAQRQVEAGLAAGGVKGTVKALGAMGAEGAAQTAGQYIGHASLADKEVTAEGLTGALGTGFAFGAVGGGAVLGVANGSMAARRLFSRVMDGKKAATAAESSWSLASQESLEADMSTARAAETKLENIRKAKMEALRGRNEARSAAQEASLDARGARAPKAKEPSDFEAGIPTNVIPKEKVPVDFEAGMKTDVRQAPVEIAPTDTNFPRDVKGGTPTSELEGPSPLIDVGDQPQGAATSVFKKPAAVDAKAAPATDLEAKLAGTKAKLDGGASLKDIKAKPEKPPFKAQPDDVDPMNLDEERLFALGELRRGGRTKDQLLKAADLHMRKQETLSEIRFKATEDLLGPQVAKQERDLADAMDEYTAARKEFEEIITPARDGFDTPSELDTTAVGRPASKRQAMDILDDAHEEALLRARHASDPQEAGQAISEANELEKLLEGLVAPSLHSPGTQVTDDWLAAVAKVARYEKASAKLADEIGDVAHPVSIEKTKLLRAAERDSERKMYDRSARATDDAADGIHPKVSAAKAARKAQIDAQRALDDVSAQHQEAKHDFSAASKKVTAGERAKKDALREDAKLARGTKSGVNAADVGGISEFLDIPGMPKPSDLPIIGPLVGAYLKFRMIKKAMGHAMGKVPATPDARVAALASQTRDRVARAVDRSLGVIERSAKAVQRVAPPLAGVLAHRIYDDGEPDEKKGADIQDLAAARMRELAAYVHTPGAIERDVRRELAGVTDPDLIAAVETQRRAAMEFLLSVAPKMPEPNLLNPVKYRPAPAVALSFARSMEALGDPPSAFERLAHEQTMISLEAAEALRKVYPRLFSEAGARLMERAMEGNLRVPLRTRVQLSLLYKVPLDPALDPDNLRITQSVYERKISSPAYNPAAPGVAPPAPTAVPSIANPVNLSQGLTPAADRR